MMLIIMMMMKMMIMLLPDEAPSTRDTMLSYLPMCYTLERCCQLVTVLGGGETSRRFDSKCCGAGRIGFYCGSMRAIRRDMRDLRPSLVPAVPRVLNRMYAEATGTAARRLLGEAATRGALY